VGGIAEHLQHDRAQQTGWRELGSPDIRRLVLIGVGLAVLQQWSGINILFNYAEEVYRSAGYGVNDIPFNIVITGAVNLIFTLLAMLFVDRIGRRFLMLLGCASVGLVHVALAIVYRLHLHGLPILLLTPCAIGCYAMTLAPVTWVLITEIFPNRIRARGVSLAVSALWASSFLLTFSFPALTRTFGQAGAFVVYGVTCLGVGCACADWCLRRRDAVSSRLKTRLETRSGTLPHTNSGHQAPRASAAAVARALLRTRSAKSGRLLRKTVCGANRVACSGRTRSTR
jgi:MFS transporter, SP family, xylose:H+ symportor